MTRAIYLETPVYETSCANCCKKGQLVLYKLNLAQRPDYFAIIKSQPGISRTKNYPRLH